MGRSTRRIIPYIRVFEDCVKSCHAVIGKTDEFKGAYYEIREIEFDVSGSKETKEIEVIDLLLDKIIVYNDRLSIKLKYVKEEPDNDPKNKDPDRNNSDQGLCIIRYPIEVTRTNRGGITETMIPTIELLL